MWKRRGPFGVCVLAVTACSAGPASTSADAGPGGADATRPDAGSVDTPDAAPDAPPDAPAITGAALQVNDVSILFPLPPTVAERDALLAATSAGPRGEILPARVYSAAGGMLAVGGQVDLAELRVVAMRLDPCFAVTSPPLDGTGCEAQLRLVLQPISPFVGASGTLEASDAAVHTFHRIPRAEAFALASSLITLRLAATSGEALGPLAPHPVIAAQGLTGSYARGVRDLVLAHAGSANLVRVAIMSSTASQAWSFQIFDVAGAASASPTLAARDIATLPAATQHHDLTIFESGQSVGFFVGFSPAMSGPTAFTDLASSNLASMLTPSARSSQFDGLVATENPRLTTPETTACGSCHVAMLVRTRIAGPEYGLQAAASANVFAPAAQFVSPSDLRPTVASAGFNLHAFSYNGAEPGISARTAHESAAVIEYLNLATP